MLVHLDPVVVQKGYDDMVKTYTERYDAAMQEAGAPKSGGKAV